MYWKKTVKSVASCSCNEQTPEIFSGGYMGVLFHKWMNI